MLKSDWVFPNIPFLPLPRLIILEAIILLSTINFSNVHSPATNIAGECTFEKLIVDSKIMASKIIKRGRGRNGMFGKTQSDFSMIALKLRF
jgi:hypothetical protein